MDKNHHWLGASTLPNVWGKGEEEEEVEQANGLISGQTEGDIQSVFSSSGGFGHLFNLIFYYFFSPSKHGTLAF